MDTNAKEPFTALGFSLMSALSANSRAEAVAAIMSRNAESAKHSLSLTAAQAEALCATREQTLVKTGRIEFGTGITDKLIDAFCDSPYLSMQNYEETLHELTALFYEAKNETLDAVSDKELIYFMKKAFDGICAGSTELLSGVALEKLARHIRAGGTYANFGTEDIFKAD